MTNVFFLVVVFGGGFAMTPYTDEAACNAAISGLASGIVQEAGCFPAKVLAPSDAEAPEMAPVPERKGGSRV